MFRSLAIHFVLSRDWTTNFTQFMTLETQPLAGFSATGLSSVVLTALDRIGFVTPTPIQEQAIPVAVQGHDLIGIAQTGTGKTMAFGLPIINSLLARRGRALIVVPTRELALQVEESLRQILRLMNTPLRTACLIGGTPITPQIRDLRFNPAIIIATPGRLNDHLERNTMHLGAVRFLVLDEADRMLDMGFAPQIQRICTTLPAERQTMLFSATMPPEIVTLAQTYLRDPVRVEVVPIGTSHEQIKQELCYVGQDAKPDLLGELLTEHAGTVLVFSRTKHGASKLARKVQEMGHTSAEIHSDRSLGQRRQALDGFKSGRYRVLVATDVASRGIDVHDIAVVINYDLPDAAEDYVHRIGRTGRAGKSGLAISFATPDQHNDVRAIERLTRYALPLSSRSGPAPMPRYAANSSRPRFGGPRRSGSPRPPARRSYR